MDTGQSVARVVGSAGPETARLDVGRLEAVAKELCRASLAPSSSKTYQSAQKIFTEFCLTCGKTPLPASEQLLILFVADLADRVCFSTASTYLATIRHMHIAQGYGDPLKGCLQLELVLKWLNRRRPRSQDSRLPIMPFVLLRIKSVLDKDLHKYDNILLWAACCLGFFAFLRSAKFTVSSSRQFDPTCHLTPQDIAVDNVQQPAVMKICIKASKTDQTKIGIDLYVGRTDNAICPIAAVLAYLAVRDQAEGPLFKLEDGRPLTQELLVQQLRSTLSQAGIDCARYSGYSFRIGAATTAMARGVSESTVQILGRWASDSFKWYVRIPRQELADVSRQMSSNLDI